MGLGVYFVGSSQARMGLDLAILDKLADQAVAAVADPELQKFVSAERVDERLYVDLHPAAESVEFYFDEQRLLICSAKTNTCGPGYHAFLIDWLDELGERLGLEWGADGREGYGDETLYATERDFAKLQQEMYSWLTSICDFITDEDQAEYTQLAVCLPINGPRLRGDGYDTITPLGPRERAWYERAKDDPTCAAEFFCWWNRAADALFWRQTGLHLMWCRVPWSPPQNDEFWDLYQRTHECCLLAQELDEECDVPEREMEELEQLLDGELSADDVLLNMTSDRIGYLRRILSRPVSGDWMVALPGYYYFEFDEENGTGVYFFGTRTVRLTTFTLRRETRVPTPLEAAGEPEPLSPGEELIDQRCSDPPGWAKVYWYDDEENQTGYWVLQGRTGTSGGLCLATIYFEDRDDRQWAVDTWRSLVPPPPADEDS